MVKIKGVCARRALLAALVGAWAAHSWAASVAPGRGRIERVGGENIGVVTPHPDRRYNYIPLRYGAYGQTQQLDLADTEDSPAEVEESPRPKLTPSEMVLTVMRTALDIVRNINKKRTAQAQRVSPPSHPVNVNATKTSGRGYMEDYYDEHHDTTTTTTAKPAKPRYTDPWAGYYDFLINEGSFKFWSVFQLFTAGLLLYACLSAIYYAKFNPIIPDYDREYDDYFLERSVGRKTRSLDPSTLASGLSWMGPQTFQFILNAIAKNYER